MIGSLNNAGFASYQSVLAFRQADQGALRLHALEKDNPTKPEEKKIQQSVLTQTNRSEKQNTASTELTPEQEKQVRELQQRDREVRAHEQAHATVGGPYAGSPSYTYQTGPDGKRYAVGGEVQIDVSAENDPQATIRKMEIVIRAALAPAEPSPQDRQVAAQARATKQQAQSELRQQQTEELRGDDKNPSSPVETLRVLIEEQREQVA